MRRQIRIRTRTLLLIALAVAVAAQALPLCFGSRPIVREPSGGDELDFLLDVYVEPGGFEYNDVTRYELPLFDARNDSWTLDGEPLSEFAGHVYGLEVGPHGSSPFVVVAFTENVTVGDYRKALASLAQHGICRVGVYEPRSNQNLPSLRSDSKPDDFDYVPVFHVRKVRFETGVTHACLDRFPAWAPWSNYRE